MNKDYILLIITLIILAFWWAFFQTNLNNVLLAKEIEKDPFFIAQISFPIKQVPNITAQSAISIRIGEQERIIFEKNITEKLPIASLTKLMTALVALDFYSLEANIEISQKAVSQSEENGQLKLGEILSVENLLHVMLIESSNDAAFALTEEVGNKRFVQLMNLKAKTLGMIDTFFIEPTGLDPEETKEQDLNISTCNDLVLLAKHILNKPFILNILSKKEYELYLRNGLFHHLLKNTNLLLGTLSDLIGGKTGFTGEAGGCLLSFFRSKKPNEYIITIVLNSQDKFGDTEKLIKYSR